MTSGNWGKVPMGGAEISALNLGEELLKQGHQLQYYLQRCQPFETANLKVELHENVWKDDHEIFICVRPHRILNPKFRKDEFHLIQKLKIILWSGDAFDQPSNNIFFDRDTALSVNTFVFKSNWQRDKILEKFFYIDKSKTKVIYNGFKDSYFKNLEITHQKNRFIHTSTWYRGVYNFIRIWPKLLKYIPDAEIHVFSKTSLYYELNQKDTKWFQIAEELVQLPGMVLREPVPQRILAMELRKAYLMLYPNTGFVESSCGSALQSLAAGTPVIATARAGLPETVGKAGILIDESEGWEDKFVEGVVNLCQKPNEREILSEIGLSQVKDQSWTQVAIRWADFLKSL
uniref:Putative glycosyltransferase n=1 Tax=viral metagenome TaxID=1070528 RepID=A0A6M3L528_9ZZZZ